MQWLNPTTKQAPLYAVGGAIVGWSDDILGWLGNLDFICRAVLRDEQCDAVASRAASMSTAQAFIVLAGIAIILWAERRRNSAWLSGVSKNQSDMEGEFQLLKTSFEKLKAASLETKKLTGEIADMQLQLGNYGRDFSEALIRANDDNRMTFASQTFVIDNREEIETKLEELDRRICEFQYLFVKIEDEPENAQED